MPPEPTSGYGSRISELTADGRESRFGWQGYNVVAGASTSPRGSRFAPASSFALVGVNASMVGFGWLQEHYEQPGGGWWPFALGCGAGIVPWIAIGVCLAHPGSPAKPPWFVHASFSCRSSSSS